MDGLREGRGADSQAICVVFAVSFGTRPVHSAKMQSSARPSAGLRFRFRPTPHAQSPPNYKLHSIKKSCRGAQININSMNINCQDELLGLQGMAGKWGKVGKRGGGQWLVFAGGSIDLHIGRHDDGDNAHGPNAHKHGQKESGIEKWPDFVLTSQEGYNGLRRF